MIMSIPQLQIEILGDVPFAFQKEIRAELEGCYRTLLIPQGRASISAPYVKVCLLDTVERLREFLAKEKEEMGVGPSESESFLALHDAWRGIPRITVCLERIEGLPRRLCQGALHQMVAHTILHGSTKYYLFKLSRPVLSKGRERGLATPVLQKLLYLVAIAVKDYEAVRLLIEHGCMESQIALALHQLEISQEDRMIWSLARSNPQTRLLYLTAQLKPLLFAWPLAERLLSPQLILSKVQALLTSLPSEEGGKLSSLTGRIALQLGQDTHRNVEIALQLTLETL